MNLFIFLNNFNTYRISGIMKNLPRTPIIVGVVLIVGIVIGYFVSNISYILNQQGVEQNIKKFYELAIPGSTAEVVSLTESNGVYKSLVKVTSSSGVTYSEGYVTKDGKLLTQSESVILLEESIKQIGNSKNFIDCLYNKSVRIYGVVNQTANPVGAQATLLQLSILGRLYSPRLFVSCDDQFIQNCLNQKISEVPSVVIGKDIDAGIKTIDWFVNKTGCKV